MSRRIAKQRLRGREANPGAIGENSHDPRSGLVAALFEAMARGFDAASMRFQAQRRAIGKRHCMGVAHSPAGRWIFGARGADEHCQGKPGPQDRSPLKHENSPIESSQAAEAAILSERCTRACRMAWWSPVRRRVEAGALHARILPRPMTIDLDAQRNAQEGTNKHEAREHDEVVKRRVDHQ